MSYHFYKILIGVAIFQHEKCYKSCLVGAMPSLYMREHVQTELADAIVFAQLIFSLHVA